MYHNGLNISRFNNKRVLVTGASGLIGKSILRELYYISKNGQCSMNVVALMRNKEKIDKSMRQMIDNGFLKVIIQDITEPIYVDFDIDYIIHAASITDSKMMIENPVEVINISILGTMNILEFAKEKKISSLVYLSSMEAYGFTTEKILLKEDCIQFLNPLEVRSCYPESKRMCENLCISYFEEFGVPTKIVRLAQTFGKGVSLSDKRVFAEFARCIIEHKNIELLSDGSSSRMYLDTSDAAMGILTVLLDGQNGSAYNCANKETYCSILEMAQMVSKEFGEGKIEVILKKGDLKKFSPPHSFFLDVSKIESLGWKPKKNLKDMYKSMMEGWK